MILPTCWAVYGKVILSQSIKTTYLNQFAIRMDQSIIKNKLSASMTVSNPFNSHAKLHKEIAVPTSLCFLGMNIWAVYSGFRCGLISAA